MSFLHRRGNLNSAAEAIRSTKWCEEDLLQRPILSHQDMRSLLNRAMEGEVSYPDLQAWADAIEGRTDLVEYESQLIADTLFEIATPEINGELTSDRIQELLSHLP